MTGITIEFLSAAHSRPSVRALAQTAKQHLTFAHALLFAAGLLCGISITMGLRVAIPRLVHVITAPSPTATLGGVDLRDPVYDLKTMPKAVWNIPAPLEVDIQRAKQDLDAALSEPRK